MLRSVWLQELTWEDIAEYLEANNIVIVPVGSTEQHGPAGPLGVDSYAAIGLAEDAAKEAGVLVAPPLWYGDSPHHLGFPGTVSLRTETLVAVIKDVISSLAGHGFTKIIIINGHRLANNAAITAACRSVHQYDLPQTFLALVDPVYLAKGIASIKESVEHHAGELELSHILYRFPSLVKKEKLPTQGVDLVPIMSRFVSKDLMGGSGDTIEVFCNSREQKAFAPSGSYSDSSKATAEKGREYHQYMIRNLVEFIEWVRHYEGPIGRT
jgi:creatinine amidohydrolase